MKGKIITREKCNLCGGELEWKPDKNGCFCRKHPQVAATRFVVRFPGGIYRNFTNYYEAEDMLNYLRHEFKNRKDRFNPDDYKSAKPNSFIALKDKYLTTKKTLKSFRKIEDTIDRAGEHFGYTNIREINGGDIEDYLLSIPNISEKTRYNHMTYLRNFWKWCLKRGNIITLAEMPMFPEINYELGYRKITDWDTQEKVIEKIRELTYDFNPKIWLGIDMLATYTALRPDDLRRITEDSLDENGFLIIHIPTKLKNKFKVIQLHEDHLNEWKALQDKYPALPDMPFFRHVKGNGGAKPNSLFGKDYFYRWWNTACEEVGLKGVSLYPGTKHTTATETAKFLGKEKALRASGLTNKAFERYCQAENEGTLEVVQAIRKKKKKADILPFRKPKKGTE